MNSQREADGYTHHILHLTEHPYFKRIPVEGEGGRSWSKANGSDGRKTLNSTSHCMKGIHQLLTFIQKEDI